ncbi:MAG TPA: hypothetical protein VMV10_05915 [Pirellulales bacterium]|nr:hypothetical protein [Pirellulales bacterium]
MTKTLIELSEEAFAALFPLRANHLNPGASWEHPDGGGCLFDTCGEEFTFAERSDNRTIWTLIDEDDGKPCVLSGFHIINCVGYLVSTVQAPVGVRIRVTLDRDEHRDLFPPNRRRVTMAAEVIAAYGLGNELENLIDLIADIRHWCDERGENFAKLDCTAFRHYAAERKLKED